MRAITINRYGDANILTLADIDKPVPADDQILVRVEASSINPVDWKIRRGDIKLLTGNRFPRILGVDFAGVVESVGNSACRYKPGEAVFGLANPLKTVYGAYAQYTLTESDSVAHKPEALPFIDAACIPVAGLTAIKSLSTLMNLQAGQTVLIHGASGGVGTFAVQIAKSMNLKVYATCGASNVEFVKGLGADVVFDYRETDVSTINAKFDGILDASAKLQYAKVRHLLTTGGTYVSTVPTVENILATATTSLLPGRKCKLVLASGGAQTPSQLKQLADLIVNGKMRVEIQRTIELADLREVHKIAEQGHNRGKIAIDIGVSSQSAELG